MLKVDVTNPSPDASHSALVDLSRNASVISTSSSEVSTNGEPTSTLLATPRPRPVRTFSSPRSRSPASPSPRSSRPPAYLPKELTIANDSPHSRAASKTRSKSRGRNSMLSLDDFEFGETIGEGSYSTVICATLTSSGKKYAIKIIDKAYLIRKQKIGVAMVEKNALTKLLPGHPGIVRLYRTFQDAASLYFVLDLATNGEMQSLISRLGSLSTRCAQYYAAQLVDALDYMHGKGVVHRDMKPENVLLDDSWRIKIADFGTAKDLDNPTEAEKFVGTAQYVAPELLEANETSTSSDLWALGCILYQMLAGRFVFSGLSEFLTLQKIKKMEYSFPESFDEQAKDLVEKLLVRDPTQRLGAGAPGEPNDMSALRSHPFFLGVEWDTLWIDPAPPLEAGLVKREHPLAQKGDKDWEDVGALWDKQVNEDGDGVEWASDSDERQRALFRQDLFQSPPTQSVDIAIGPMGETRALEASPVESKQPRLPSVRDHSTSSSDGADGEVDRVAEQMQALKRPTSRLPSDTSINEYERGRRQTMTPIQGNGPRIDLVSLLDLAEGETILFRSSVEARSIRRRASRLLPLASVQMKPKTRELILTSRRLVCLKLREKTPEIITLKAELLLPVESTSSSPKDGKEKETRSVVSSAELKGDREFVVLSSSKNYHYATLDPQAAAIWVEKINAILPLNKN